MASLGKKLLKFRQESNLSQSQIAEKLSVSQAAYGKWEADEHKPSADNLYKIAMFYNIDIDDLLDENKQFVISGNEFNGENNNNFVGNSTTINVEMPKDFKALIENFLQNQFQIIEIQSKILSELVQNDKK